MIYLWAAIGLIVALLALSERARRRAMTAKKRAEEDAEQEYENFIL